MKTNRKPMPRTRRALALALRTGLAIGAVQAALSHPAYAADAAMPTRLLSLQDAKTMLVDGQRKIVPGTDSLAVIEVGADRARVVGSVAVPVSVLGPPMSVALRPDGRRALVTAAMRRDPADASRLVPGNTVSLIALDGPTPRVVATAEAGAGASGTSFSPDGRYAYAANRNDSTVTVFEVRDDGLQAVQTVDFGGAKAVPNHVVVTRDGRRALVSRDADGKISLYAIDNGRLRHLRELGAGLRPFAIDLSARGDRAVVTNIGAGLGDVDTVSLIDLREGAERVIDTVSVGQTPEGVAFAPDGVHVAVTLINGSTLPRDARGWHAGGVLAVLRVEGEHLVRVAQTEVGAWPQGVQFAPDGKRLFVQSAGRRQIEVYRFESGRIVDTGERLVFDGAPAALRQLAFAAPPQPDMQLRGDRFRPLTYGELDPEQRAMADGVLAGDRGSMNGPYNILLRSPRMGDLAQRYGAHVRFHSSLPRKLNELAILMTARFWNSEYEWYAHRRYAIAAGLAVPVVEAIRARQRPAALDADEAIVYRFVDELLQTRQVGDEAFRAAVARFGERGVVDLVGVIGYYHVVSMLLNIDRYPLPADGRPEMQ